MRSKSKVFWFWLTVCSFVGAVLLRPIFGIFGWLFTLLSESYGAITIYYYPVAWMIGLGEYIPDTPDDSSGPGLSMIFLYFVGLVLAIVVHLVVGSTIYFIAEQMWDTSHYTPAEIKRKRRYKMGNCPRCGNERPLVTTGDRGPLPARREYCSNKQCKWMELGSNHLVWGFHEDESEEGIKEDVSHDG